MLLELTPQQVNALKRLKELGYVREELNNNSWGDCSAHYSHYIRLGVWNKERAKELIEVFSGVAKIAENTTMPNYQI